MMNRFALAVALAALGNTFAWTCRETPTSSVQDSGRRYFFGVMPQSLAVATGGVLFPGVQPAFAEGEDAALAVEPPLASLSGDAKKVSFCELI